MKRLNKTEHPGPRKMDAAYPTISHNAVVLLRGESAASDHRIAPMHGRVGCERRNSGQSNAELRKRRNEEAPPQPPNTSQKVPKNSAASFRDIKPSFVINAQACSWEPVDSLPSELRQPARIIYGCAMEMLLYPRSASQRQFGKVLEQGCAWQRAGQPTTCSPTACRRPRLGPN